MKALGRSRETVTLPGGWGGRLVSRTPRPPSLYFLLACGGNCFRACPVCAVASSPVQPRLALCSGSLRAGALSMPVPPLIGRGMLIGVFALSAFRCAWSWWPIEGTTEVVHLLGYLSILNAFDILRVQTYHRLFLLVREKLEESKNGVTYTLV